MNFNGKPAMDEQIRLQGAGKADVLPRFPPEGVQIGK